MTFDTIRKLLVYLSIAFVAVSVWSDPSGSAEAAGTFMTSVGGFMSVAIEKGSEFLRGLTN